MMGFERLEDRRLLAVTDIIATGAVDIDFQDVDVAVGQEGELVTLDYSGLLAEVDLVVNFAEQTVDLSFVNGDDSLTLNHTPEQTDVSIESDDFNLHVDTEGADLQVDVEEGEVEVDLIDPDWALELDSATDETDLALITTHADRTLAVDLLYTAETLALDLDGTTPDLAGDLSLGADGVLNLSVAETDHVVTLLAEPEAYDLDIATDEGSLAADLAEDVLTIDLLLSDLSMVLVS